jgi:hypothetical protein
LVLRAFGQFSVWPLILIGPVRRLEPLFAGAFAAQVIRPWLDSFSMLCTMQYRCHWVLTLAWPRSMNRLSDQRQHAQSQKIVIQSPHRFMRLARPKWLESLIWRGGWKTTQDDNWQRAKNTCLSATWSGKACQSSGNLTMQTLSIPYPLAGSCADKLRGGLTWKRPGSVL